jgi:hypothetical protein
MKRAILGYASVVPHFATDLRTPDHFWYSFTNEPYNLMLPRPRRLQKELLHAFRLVLHKTLKHPNCNRLRPLVLNSKVETDDPISACICMTVDCRALPVPQSRAATHGQRSAFELIAFPFYSHGAAANQYKLLVCFPTFPDHPKCETLPICSIIYLLSC